MKILRQGERFTQFGRNGPEDTTRGSFMVQMDDFSKVNHISGILTKVVPESKFPRDFETGRESFIQFDRNRPEDAAAPF